MYHSFRPVNRMYSVSFVFAVYLAIVIQASASSSQEWETFVYSKPVTALADDKDCIWIGSHAGLVKMDKTTFSTQVFSMHTCDLTDNSITAILIDSTGTKWIGTRNGLAAYNDIEWTGYDTLNSRLPGNYITSLACNPSGDLWVGTTNGCAVFDGATWISYDSDNSGLPYNSITSIAISREQHIWIGTQLGLSEFTGTDWNLYYTYNSPLPGNDISSIYIDAADRKWIGTTSGLAILEADTWHNSIMQNADIVRIASDSYGQVWIGTNESLADADGMDRISRSFAAPDSGGFEITSFLCDGGEPLWLGTSDGFFYCSDSQWTERSIFQCSLTDNYIEGIAVAPDGAIWILNPATVSVLYRGQWSLHTFDNNENQYIYPTAITFSTGGNALVATTSGMATYDGNELTLSPSESNSSVYCMAADSAGRVWKGCYDGLVSHDGFLYDTSNSLLPSNAVRALAIHDGIVYAGTDNGIAIKDGSTWTIYDTTNSAWPKDIPNVELSGNQVRSIAIDTKGRIWFSCAGGLGIINDTGLTAFSSIHPEIGSQQFGPIAAASDGSVWAGIFFTRNDNAIYNITDTGFTKTPLYHSGLPAYSVNSLAIDSSGNIWIGTESGVAVYNPNGISAAARGSRKPAQALSTGISTERFPGYISISYSLHEYTSVDISIYSLCGRKCATAEHVNKKPGYYAVPFRTKGLSSGTYIIRLKTNTMQYSEKMFHY
jgi:ligand-binding sensor domain-containing protein